MKKFSILLLSTLLISVIVAGCTMTGSDTTTTTQNGTQSLTTETNGTNVAETSLTPSDVALNSFSNEKVVWGPGRADDHMRPTDPVALQEKYGRLGGQFIMSDDKFVCLTFDEGYENGYTPSILDTLKEKNVRAVFFVTYDFVKDNPKLIERMIDEGHIIGNHTYRHYTLDEVDEKTAEEEIQFLHKYMKENFRYRMTLFRFPKGEFSEKTLALADDLGYKSIFWSFAYADWDTENPADPKVAFDEITKHTHNGEIMLLHAVSKTNAEILGDVIDEVSKQGYQFTTEL